MEEIKNWIFTFGSNHAHPGHYVKILGTFTTAREEMHRRYGDKWAFQYSEDEWNEMINDNDRNWIMEKEWKE